MRAPCAGDAKDWATHFGLRRAENHIVLAGLPSMIGQESYEMIPGLQLIDRDFMLRADSTGPVNQRHDLYRELLPRISAMLSGVSRFATPNSWTAPLCRQSAASCLLSVCVQLVLLRQEFATLHEMGFKRAELCRSRLEMSPFAPRKCVLSRSERRQ